MPIGNYVHYYARSINDGEASACLEGMRQKKLSEINRMNANIKGLDQLGEELAKMKALLSSNTDAKTPEGQIQQAIFDFIEDSTQATLASIDWSSGRAIIKNTKAGVGQIRSRADLSSLERIQYIHKHFAKLYQTIQPDSDGTLKLSTLRDVIKQARAVKGELNTAACDAMNRLNGLNLKNGSMMQKSLSRAIEALNSNNFDPRNKDISLLIKTINDCIRLLAPIQAYQLAQGNLFEAMLSALNYTRDGYANKISDELSSMVLSGVKGGERATVAYNRNNFDQRVADRLFSKHVGEFALMASASPTQGKVDVVIQAGSNPNIGNNIDLNISAKNVNLGLSHGWIHTVSGTSLLALLQDESADYVNHYINLFAEHPDKDADSALNNARQSYTKLTNFLIAMKALTGEVTRISSDGTKVDDSANVFVVNDSSTGKFYVYSMASIKQELMKRYINSTSDQLSGGSNVISIKGVPTRFKNDFVNGDLETAKWTRVAQVLSDVHATKISASININIMQLMR